jgi:hypothetical protein
VPIGVYARPRRKGPLAWPTAMPPTGPVEHSPIILTDDGDVTVSHRPPTDVDHWSCSECGRSFRRARNGHWALARGRAS